MVYRRKYLPDHIIADSKLLAAWEGGPMVDSDNFNIFLCKILQSGASAGVKNVANEQPVGWQLKGQQLATMTTLFVFISSTFASKSIWLLGR
jgi:hypothetical protein